MRINQRNELLKLQGQYVLCCTYVHWTGVYNCTVINMCHVIKSTYPLEQHHQNISSDGIIIRNKRNIIHLVQVAE